MNTTYKLTSSGPQESCRTDYSSHTFKLHTEDHSQEMLGYVWGLAEKVLPTGEPLERLKGQFFDVRYAHPSGLSLEMSGPDSQKSTANCGSLVIPGAVWGALDASERRDLIVDVYKWPGYYRTTRWDAQITSLNPPITVYDVIEHVAAGKLWAARIASQQSWERRDKDGLIIEPPTQYFGSPQSNVRVRIYDHGAKHDWQVPSLRVETQLRKDTANQHFSRLGDRCLSEANEDPLFVSQEERTVKDALMQHADLKDTSAWAGRPKPRNWASEAPRPAWYAEMLSHTADPLAIAHKAELGWEKTMQAMVEQYGRKLWLYVMQQTLTGELNEDEIMSCILLLCANKLKKGDDALLASAVPKGAKRAARDAYRFHTNAAAKAMEESDWSLK
jgi:hypothetical protein